MIKGERREDRDGERRAERREREREQAREMSVKSEETGEGQERRI